MSGSGFNDYLREYQAEGIGQLLYGLILDVVRQTVRRYPPVVYSPNGVWDEDATRALAHDFTMDKLLRRGRLEYYLLAQESVDSLRNLLQRDFRHFLISHKRRSEATNLFKRIQDILRGNPQFQVCTEYDNRTRSIWGLAGWEHMELAERVEDVARAMFAVDLPPLIRYRADSAKHSPLLSNEDLTHLLDATLRTMGKCIGRDLLMDALRYRLQLFDTALISLDAPLWTGTEESALLYRDIIASPDDLEGQVAAQEMATDLFERLSARQRAVLALHFSAGRLTLDQIGRRIGVSKSTVHNDLNTIAEYISILGVTPEEAELIFSCLAELSVTYVQQYPLWEGGAR